MRAYTRKVLVSCAVVGAVALGLEAHSSEALQRSLLLHASFDNGPDADFAKGDSALYTAPDRKRDAAVKGLVSGNGIEIKPDAGRHGGYLRFGGTSKDIVFFKGPANLGFKERDWSGSASFWMKLSPDEDLQPGYCDPLQFVAQAWGEGNMFVEFSKDHTPRHFRYAIMAVTKLWNPNGEKWEEMTRRPMTAVEKPPFRKDRWTHVCFTFGNANTGKKDGWGRLYLDGVRVGEFTGWENSFNWVVSESALTLGYNYTGQLDDLAVFDRDLTDDEVKIIYNAEGGVASLRKRQ